MEHNNHELKQFFAPGKTVHLIGIGGVSMRPLGLVLQGMGMLVTGSDMNASVSTDELIAKGQKANYATILKEIQQRDYQDTHREVAPLKMCRDSIKLDTSDMTIEEVVAEMRRIVKEKIPV